MQTFYLVPFEPKKSVNQVEVGFELIDNKLHLKYLLSGSLDKILKLDESLQINRKNEIWKSTCFEFFLKSPQQNHYWEMNLSPSGDWNFYHLEDYRKSLKEEALIGTPQIQKDFNGEKFQLSCSFDLNSLMNSIMISKGIAASVFQMGLSCILQKRDLTVEYYSLGHSKEKPDFHNSQFFLASLKFSP